MNQDDPSVLVPYAEMSIEKRLAALEARVAELEFEMLRFRPLGPQQKDLLPDPKVVNELVEAAKKALNRT
jgi:hypothetical protein